METIRTTEATGQAPPQPPVSLASLVQGRGRYTHRTFWRSMLLEALDGDGVARGIEPVTTRAQAREGFADLYDGEEAARDLRASGTVEWIPKIMLQTSWMIPSRVYHVAEGIT